MRRLALLALALCCLLASGPFHEFLHHGDVDPPSGRLELHAGDCVHFDGDRPGHDERCLLCAKGRASPLSLPPAHAVALANASIGHACPAHDNVRVGLRFTSTLGARGPPALG